MLGGANSVSSSLDQVSEAKLLARWTPAHRFGFRFVFIYLAVYLQWATTAALFTALHTLAAFWNYVTPWVGRHLFHLTQSGPLDGGDAAAHYVLCFCILVLATVGAIVWSFLDRKRVNYLALHEWLRLVTRYALASILFSYGLSKVFLLQFKGPMFHDLIAPVGELSPMQILWTFMGISPMYTFFAGAVETAGAALLLFRRTTVLGALISSGALLNVLMLNLSYGVSVKLYSMNLLLMAVFLLTPDIRALSDLLIFRRMAMPNQGAAALLQGRPMRIATTIVALGFVGGTVYSDVLPDWWYYKQYYVHPVRPPLAGVYEVERFARSGMEVPASDGAKWSEVAFDGTWSGVAGGRLTVRMGRTPAAWRVLDLQYDTAIRSITMTGHFNHNFHGTMAYSLLDPEHVLLSGKFGEDALSIHLRWVDASQYMLVKLKPFHWVRP